MSFFSYVLSATDPEEYVRVKNAWIKVKEEVLPELVSVLNAQSLARDSENSGQALNALSLLNEVDEKDPKIQSIFKKLVAPLFDSIDPKFLGVVGVSKKLSPADCVNRARLCVGVMVEDLVKMDSEVRTLKKNWLKKVVSRTPGANDKAPESTTALESKKWTSMKAKTWLIGQLIVDSSTNIEPYSLYSYINQQLNLRLPEAFDAKILSTEVMWPVQKLLLSHWQSKLESFEAHLAERLGNIKQPFWLDAGWSIQKECALTGDWKKGLLAFVNDKEKIKILSSSDPEQNTLNVKLGSHELTEDPEGLVQICALLKPVWQTQVSHQMYAEQYGTTVRFGGRVGVQQDSFTPNSALYFLYQSLINEPSLNGQAQRSGGWDGPYEPNWGSSLDDFAQLSVLLPQKSQDVIDVLAAQWSAPFNPQNGDLVGERQWKKSFSNANNTNGEVSDGLDQAFAGLDSVQRAQISKWLESVPMVDGISIDQYITHARYDMGLNNLLAVPPVAGVIKKTPQKVSGQQSPEGNLGILDGIESVRAKIKFSRTGKSLLPQIPTNGSNSDYESIGDYESSYEYNKNSYSRKSESMYEYKRYYDYDRHDEQYLMHQRKLAVKTAKQSHEVSSAMFNFWRNHLQDLRSILDPQKNGENLSLLYPLWAIKAHRVAHGLIQTGKEGLAFRYKEFKGKNKTSKDPNCINFPISDQSHWIIEKLARLPIGDATSFDKKNAPDSYGVLGQSAKEALAIIDLCTLPPLSLYASIRMSIADPSEPFLLPQKKWPILLSSLTDNALIGHAWSTERLQVQKRMSHAMEVLWKQQDFREIATSIFNQGSQKEALGKKESEKDLSWLLLTPASVWEVDVFPSFKDSSARYTDILRKVKNPQLLNETFSLKPSLFSTSQADVIGGVLGQAAITLNESQFDTWVGVLPVSALAWLPYIKEDKLRSALESRSQHTNSDQTLRTKELSINVASVLKQQLGSVKTVEGQTDSVPDLSTESPVLNRKIKAGLVKDEPDCSNSRVKFKS